MPGKVIQGPWENHPTIRLVVPKELLDLQLELSSEMDYEELLRNNFQLIRNKRPPESYKILCGIILGSFLRKLSTFVEFNFEVNIIEEILHIYDETHGFSGSDNRAFGRIYYIERVTEVDQLELVTYLKVLCEYLVNDLSKPAYLKNLYLWSVRDILQEVLVDLNSIISNHSMGF